MPRSKRLKRIEDFFEFYKIRLANLKTLYNSTFYHDTNKAETFLFRVEFRILCFSYLDALAKSNDQRIAEFASQFSAKADLISRVSLGRLYNFVDLFFLYKSSQIDRIIIAQFGEKDGNKLISLTKKIQEETSTNGFELLKDALKRFSYSSMAKAGSPIALEATKCDMPVEETIKALTEFIQEDPDDFGTGKLSNKEFYVDLISSGIPVATEDLLKLFTFGQIIWRDYRNFLIHENIIPSKGYEVTDKVGNPYYSLEIRQGIKYPRLVIPDVFYLNLLAECIPKYEQFCMWKKHDPIPDVLDYEL
jgi:hypothetical protein